MDSNIKQQKQTSGTEKGKNGENNAPKQWLHWPSRQENLIDIVEVGEIRIDLQSPIGPAEHDSDNVDEGDVSRQEWAILHPGDDIM